MADVARAYGCSNENIAQLVGGGRDLKLGTAGHLCKALGLRLTIKLERETAADLLQGIGPVDDESAEQISRAIRESREEARKLDAEDIPAPQNRRNPEWV